LLNSKKRKRRDLEVKSSKLSIVGRSRLSKRKQKNNSKLNLMKPPELKLFLIHKRRTSTLMPSKQSKLGKMAAKTSSPLS
jgi:hypothetical protein